MDEDTDVVKDFVDFAKEELGDEIEIDVFDGTIENMIVAHKGNKYINLERKEDVKKAKKYLEA